MSRVSLGSAGINMPTNRGQRDQRRPRTPVGDVTVGDLLVELGEVLAPIVFSLVITHSRTSAQPTASRRSAECRLTNPPKRHGWRVRETVIAMRALEYELAGTHHRAPAKWTISGRKPPSEIEPMWAQPSNVTQGVQSAIWHALRDLAHRLLGSKQYEAPRDSSH